ncbi:MAG: hypothetical protein SFY66_07935 [Oculatellaceae cyanobacterium bins.114]|nr:hypothetical protein [Oculatellaceae cyanobacterium bins.114]
MQSVILSGLWAIAIGLSIPQGRAKRDISTVLFNLGGDVTEKIFKLLNSTGAR